MKVTHKDFKKGYNVIVTEGDNSKMQMDFGILVMDKGDIFEENQAKECVYTLLTGDVDFEFENKKENAVRGSMYHDDPIVLHTPQNTAIKIICNKDNTEIAIQRTKNPRDFEAKLLRRDDLLDAGEVRGKGVMQDAALRTTRTFFDRSNHAETNFFLGEVVGRPGKWSSFPPHYHVEPELYFYKFLPENGFGYAEVGDDVYKVKNNDATCMADGVTHSQAVAPGYTEWYFWVIRLQDDVALETIFTEEYLWVQEPDAKFFPEI